MKIVYISWISRNIPVFERIRWLWFFNGILKNLHCQQKTLQFYLFRKWRWIVGWFLYLYGMAYETITAVIVVFSAMIELFLFALVLILGSLKSVQYLRWLRSSFVKTINQIPGPGMLPILGLIPSIPRNTDGKLF